MTKCIYIRRKDASHGRRRSAGASGPGGARWKDRQHRSRIIRLPNGTTADLGKWVSKAEFDAVLVELEKLYQPKQTIVELRDVT